MTSTRCIDVRDSYIVKLTAGSGSWYFSVHVILSPPVGENVCNGESRHYNHGRPKTTAST